MTAASLAPSPLQPPVARLPRARLLPAVEVLDPADYALLHVSFGHGLRDEQLARIVGVETRAVARMRAAALGRLADELEITTGVGLAELLGTLLELPPEQWTVETGASEGEGATAAVLQRLAAVRPVAAGAPASIRAAVAAAAAIIAILLLTLGGGGRDSPLRDGAPDRAGAGTGSPALLDALADAVRRNGGREGTGGGGARDSGGRGGPAGEGGSAGVALASSALAGTSGGGSAAPGVVDGDGPVRQGRDGAGEAPPDGSPGDPAPDGGGDGAQGPGGPASPPAAGPPGRAKENEGAAAPTPGAPPSGPPATVSPPAGGSPPARGEGPPSGSPPGRGGAKDEVPAASDRDCEGEGHPDRHDAGEEDSDDE